MTARVTGAGSALPAPMEQRQLWDGFFKEHYNDARLARTVWQHSGITTRRGVARGRDPGHQKACPIDT